MVSSDVEVGLARVQENLKSLDDNLKSTIAENDKTSERIITIHDKLLSRLEQLEKENSTFDKNIKDLLDYKKTSDGRLDKLEHILSYSKGWIAGILLAGSVFGALLFWLIQNIQKIGVH